jgi:hypothetical protein
MQRKGCVPACTDESDDDVIKCWTSVEALHHDVRHAKYIRQLENLVFAVLIYDLIVLNIVLKLMCFTLIIVTG